MKKIIYSICILASLMLTASCGKEFITSKHNGSEPMSEYFINETRLFQGLVAAYDPLQWYDYFYQYTALHMVSDMMADDIYCGGSNEGDQPVLVKAHFYDATPTNVPDKIWTVSYSGINRAYHVLEFVDSTPGVSDANRALYRSEAMVLAAFYWNVLWHYWGNVPFYAENLTAPYIAPQISADELYEKIVTMIEDALAIDALPMKASGGQEGRVTKAMAYMLYAEVVMYQKDRSRYAKAYDYMTEIISNGGYSLVNDFAGIWVESGEWSSESIWEINYISEGSSRDWDHPWVCGGNVTSVLTGIPGASVDFVDGWGFGGVARKAYDMYDDSDVRRDAGILDIETYVASNGKKETEGRRWESEGLYLIKYAARVNGNHGYKGEANMAYGNNFRVYRFAETLLNAAELGLELGKESASYLKQVRDRAHSADNGTDLDSIIEERHKEFLGEGKRYWDLIRTDKAESVLKAANHSFRGNDWNPGKKYWPIPQSEIDKDPAIVQNTAYLN